MLREHSDRIATTGRTTASVRNETMGPTPGQRWALHALPRRGGLLSGSSDFVVVANRLPVDRVTDANGSVRWRRSPGGLVTALAPVMRAYNGAWVGWTGSPDDAPEPFQSEDMELVPVPLSGRDIRLYYEGFSNATLWPLYHDVIVPAEY